MNSVSELSAVKYICDLCKKESPDMLLISGCTGSGKSTLSKKLSEEMHVSLLCLDDYFKDEDEMEIVIPELGIRQWDAPGCYKWDVLVGNIQDIFRYKIAKIPNFSHERSRQMGWKQLLLGEKPLILEGLYSMRPEVLNVVQSMRLNILSIFLDIPEDIRWQRKYDRDVVGRNENPDTLRIWFDEVIKPAENKWVNQQSLIADVKVIGSS